MKRFSLILVIALLGNTIQIESQDVIARLAPIDKKASTIKENCEKNVQDTVKSLRTAKSVTALKKSPHMQFMGIPIDGIVEEIAPKLIEKGFSRGKFNNTYFSGIFYETLSGINVYTDKATGKVNCIEVRYFTGVNGLNENQMVSLYNRIVRGLKKKYTMAKFSQLDGKTLLSMPLGYISCEIYNLNISRNFGGGTYIELRYVDKINTYNYSLPRLDKADDDL